MRRAWRARGRLAVMAVALAAAVALACAGGAPSAGRGAADAPAGPTRSDAIGTPAGTVPPVAAPAATAAPALVHLRSAYTTLSGTPAPWWMAQEAGYFREQGLDVELAHITAGNNLLAAMNSGEIQITNSGGPTMVLGHLQGLDTVIIGSTSNTLDVVVFARPELRTLDDLRGKTIGVTRLKAGTDIAARMGFERLGLVPDVDIFMRGTGGLPESLAAMETGAADGAALNVPAVFMARDRGYREVFNTADLGVPWVNAAVGANRGYAREHPAVAEAVLRALAQAASRLKTDKALAMQVIGKYAQTDDQEMLARTVDYYQPIYLIDPYPEPAAVQTLLDVEELPAARTTRPEDLTVYDYIDHVRASGFLEPLPR